MAYDDTFHKLPIVETERLLLRDLRMDDAPAVAAYGADPELLRYIDGFPQTPEEAEAIIGAWIGEAYASHQFIRWGIELKAEGTLIGGIYLFAPVGDDISGRRMDIGYELDKKYWGKGYTTEAICAVTRYGFTDMGLRRIQAQIMPENAASIRACEKAGYRMEGILRNYCHYCAGRNELKTMAMLSCIPEDIEPDLQ